MFDGFHPGPLDRDLTAAMGDWLEEVERLSRFAASAPIQMSDSAAGVLFISPEDQALLLRALRRHEDLSQEIRRRTVFASDLLGRRSLRGDHEESRLCRRSVVANDTLLSRGLIREEVFDSIVRRPLFVTSPFLVRRRAIEEVEEVYFRKRLQAVTLTSQNLQLSSSSLTVTTGSTGTVTWDSEVFDTDNFWSSGDPTKIYFNDRTDGKSFIVAVGLTCAHSNTNPATVAGYLTPTMAPSYYGFGDPIDLTLSRIPSSAALEYSGYWFVTGSKNTPLTFQITNNEEGSIDLTDIDLRMVMLV